MPELYKAPIGTRDVLPPESWRHRELARLALDQFARAGYLPIETPMFEHTEVFERGVGEASEVVNKEMYTFVDRGGRSLTLRPEGTAPVMRAVLEHMLQRGSLAGAVPVKLCYHAAMFRYERPQKGRFRQHTQVGIEAIGSESPVVDAEVIAVGQRFLAAAGVDSRLLINSIGHLDPSCRLGYLEELRAYLQERRDELPPQDRERAERNPLRTFDSKEDATAAVMAEAPLITDHLCDACAKHLGEVRALLDELGIAHELSPRLVRGLDYYTRTAFEFVSDALGAQSTVLGGGRYDGLSELLGGPRLPGIGFGCGIDRVLLAGTFDVSPPPTDAYVVTIGERATQRGFRLTFELRDAGFAVLCDLAGRGIKGQMKDAARSGARWAVIIGDDELGRDEVTLRDMGTGHEEPVAFGDVAGRLRT